MLLGIIRQCPLFAGIEDSNLQSLLDCLAASRREYRKNEYIFASGDSVSSIGIVLCGGVHIVREDYWGRRTILAHIEASKLFGESFSCAEIDNMPVSVIASEKTELLLIDHNRIIKSCSKSCTFHAQLINNTI